MTMLRNDDASNDDASMMIVGYDDSSMTIPE
jgi:hypothetical protein